MKSKIKVIILSFIAQVCFEILFRLNKINIKGERYLLELIKSDQPAMVCVWHGRLLFPCWYLRSRTKNVYAIASKHRDAEIISKILKRWGYGLIRGSTNKDGKTVIQKMKYVFKQGGFVAVTNDGPKGPAKIAKAGSTSLAMEQNVQIISITGSATKKWIMKSWDSFMLPKPFGKIQIVISPPMKISKKPDSINDEIDYLSSFINKYQDQADKILQPPN